ERELLGLALGMEMQRRARAEQELACSYQLFVFAGSDDLAVEQGFEIGSVSLDARDPQRVVEIAKPALPFLDVRLEDEHRTAVPGVPAPRLGDLGGDEDLDVAGRELLSHDAFVFARQLRASAQE